MIKAIGFLMLLSFGAAAQDHFYVVAGVGSHDNLFGQSGWEDGGAMGCSVGAGYRRNISGRVWADAGYRHYSQCAYRHEDDESALDYIGLSIEVRW